MRLYHPPNHVNSNHRQSYMHTLQVKGFALDISDRSIDNLADNSFCGSFSVGPASPNTSFIVPIAALLNYRPGTITVDAVVDIWLVVDGVQRSGKFPLAVPVALAGKQPLAIPLVPRNADLTFWALSKSAQITIELMARRRASGDTDDKTVIFSDTSFAVVNTLADQRAS